MNYSQVNRVQVTVTDGMGRKRTLTDVVNWNERTPSVAAHELISSVCLDDGDAISVSFFCDASQ